MPAKTIASILLITLFAAASLGLTIAAAVQVLVVPLVGALWAALLLIAFFVLGWAWHWIPSSKNEQDCCTNEHGPCAPKSPPCYCEGYARGVVKQPISTWSDLAFVAAGLLILYIVATGAAPASAANPMAARDAVLAIVYGLIVVFMGPASMFLHASLKNWGGWFDNFSIVLWLTYSLFYSLIRLSGVDAGGEWVLMLLATVIFLAAITGIGLLTWFLGPARLWSVVILGAGLLVLEAVVVITDIAGEAINGVIRDGWWYLGTLIVFVAAALSKFLPEAFGVGCNADSWFQAHGLWHILAALLTVFLFMYFRSELIT